jgi:vitamin B12 transporter
VTASGGPVNCRALSLRISKALRAIPALLLAITSSYAAAESIPLWPPPIDTIHVSARHPFPEERPRTVHGFSQTIPLGDAAPISADLGDLLKRAVGIRIRRLGGLGSMSLASVRGSQPSQVALQIDDIPIASAPDALTNLSLLPVRLFESVEIARGPSEGDAAGTIRLQTPGRLAAPWRLSIGGGSFGTASLMGTGGIRVGPAAVFAAGGRLMTRGDYPYLDRRGTPYETRDDRIVHRGNNAFRQDDALVRAEWNVGRDVTLEYTGHELRKESGIPGTESMQTERVHDSFRRSLHAISIDLAPRGHGRLAGPHAMTGDGASGIARSARLSAHVQSDRDRYENPDGEVGLGRADMESRLLARGAEATFRIPVPHGSARIMGSHATESWRTEDILHGGGHRTRAREAQAAEGEWSERVGGRMEVTSRGRLSRTGPVRGFSPRVGLSGDLGCGFGFRGSWGRYLRAPSFVEMFGQGGVQQGNGALAAERGETWDIGGTWSRDLGAARLYTEIVGFENRTRDAIVWIQNSQRTTRPENLERTRIRGCEALARGMIRPARRLPMCEMTATATVERARDEGPSAVYHGKTLPYIPDRQLSVDLRLDTGRIAVEHSIDWESSLFRDRYNSADKRRPARTLHDLSASWRIVRDRCEATVAIRNLTDSRAQDIDGFPLPGRSAMAQITWTLR